MGKFILSNNKQWEDSLRKSYKKAGFIEKEHIVVNESNMTVYKKLNIDTDNYFSNGDDFIAVNGTLFYKKQMGRNALRAILEDSKIMSIKELRRHMIGSFAVIIKVENQIRVFVDETNTYFIYYFKNDREYILTNTYYHIQKMLGLPVNSYELLENMTRCTVGLRSIAKDIYKLSANQCMRIDLEADLCVVEECPLNDYKIEFKSKEEFVDKLYEYLQDISQIRSQNIGRYQLFLTGGLDSRLQLATHVQAHDEVITAYWKGNDVVTNGTTQDLEISQQLAKECNMEFVFYDVSEQYKEAIANITPDRCNKYGEYAGLYAGNKFWYQIFERIENVDFIDFGYSGEILRELSNIDQTYHENYTMDDFVKNIYDRGGIAKNLFAYQDFYKYVVAEFCAINDVGQNNLSREECLRIFNGTRFISDCGINNFVNMFTYSFPVFFIKQISDTIASVPYEWLNNSSVSIMLIERMNKKLLNIPIYSHHRKYLYNARKSYMKKSLFFTILDKTKPLIVNTKLYSILYLKFAHKYIRPQSVGNNEILEKCMEVIKNSPTIHKASIECFNVAEWKSIDVSALAVITAGICVQDTDISDYFL